MTRSLFKTILCLVFFSPFFFYLINPINTLSAPSTNFKDQLSSAQLSYADTLTGSNAAGNSIAYVTTNNYNLDIGDTLTIGTGTYVVTGLVGTTGISLNTPLLSGDADSGDVVKAARKTVHTVSFQPQSSVTQGKWQVLIKAASSNYSDGTADSTGFDLGTLTTAGITCPWGATPSLSVVTVSTNTYHAITCALGAGITNPVGTGATGIVTIGTGSTMLINPAPASGHTVGQANASADTYSVILRHLTSTDTVIDEDTTQGKIVVTESVRVTATVDPTITFSVGTSGVTTPATTLCGTAIGNGASNTTAATVNFGSLSLGQANNLAQFIQCTTNAANGYVIQAFESAPLTMIGTSTTIPNTTCNGSCSYTTDTAWTTLTNSGFGYALQVGSTSAGAVLGITTAGNYKAFGVGYAQAQSILSRTNTPADTDSAYICYRTTISTQQPAGTYQNEINFIATATF